MNKISEAQLRTDVKAISSMVFPTIDVITKDQRLMMLCEWYGYDGGRIRHRDFPEFINKMRDANISVDYITVVDLITVISVAMDRIKGDKEHD